MKLLFIMTGGTIGSTVQGNTIAPDSLKGYQMMELYEKKYGLDISYEMIEPFSRLSENATGETLAQLIEVVLKESKKGYDGIVITHGTDTLQYASAAVGYAVGRMGIPVCFVSSNYPLEDKRANGLANLAGAIAFLKLKKTGVFISYQNKGEEIKIHQATRLIAHPIYQDRMDSLLDSYVGSFDDNFHFVPNQGYQQLEDSRRPFGTVRLGTYAKKIYTITPYPGYQYPSVNQLKEQGVCYIIHGTYHSGTIRTDDESVEKFFKETKEKGLLVFLTGTLPEISYEGTEKLRDYQGREAIVISPIALFIKLWMASEKGLDIETVIAQSMSADIVPV